MVRHLISACDPFNYIPQLEYCICYDNLQSNIIIFHVKYVIRKSHLSVHLLSRVESEIGEGFVCFLIVFV